MNFFPLVLLHFVPVLLVTPTAGMVTWFFDNLIVAFMLTVWVVCLIEDHYYLITTLNSLSDDGYYSVNCQCSFQLTIYSIHV